MFRLLIWSFSLQLFPLRPLAQPRVAVSPQRTRLKQTNCGWWSPWTPYKVSYVTGVRLNYFWPHILTRIDAYTWYHIYMNWLRENALKHFIASKSSPHESLLFYCFHFSFSKTCENGLIFVWLSSLKTSSSKAKNWKGGISVQLPTYFVLMVFPFL